MNNPQINKMYTIIVKTRLGLKIPQLTTGWLLLIFLFIKILSKQTEFPLALCLVGKKIEEKVEEKAKQTNNSVSVKAKVLSSIKRS